MGDFIKQYSSAKLGSVVEGLHGGYRSVPLDYVAQGAEKNRPIGRMSLSVDTSGFEK